MENRIFFPQAALDEWIVEGTVELQDGELTILSDASGGGDPELLGRVKARVYLDQLGAEILETSMILGDAAYDIEPGWVGVPSIAFADYAASSVASGKGRRGGDGANVGDAKSDEELLATFARGSAR
jgi:hypothetical protein